MECQDNTSGVVAIFNPVVVIADTAWKSILIGKLKLAK